MTVLLYLLMTGMSRPESIGIPQRAAWNTSDTNSKVMPVWTLGPQVEAHANKMLAMRKIKNGKNRSKEK